MEIENLSQIEKKIALEIEKEAKLRCPVDTGRLRSSIQIYEIGGEILIGSNVKYAPYVEYGTKQPNYPRQPFIRPAIDYVKNKYGR